MIKTHTTSNSPKKLTTNRKRSIWFKVSMTITSVALCGMGLAGEFLDRTQVESLLTGSTVEAHVLGKDRALSSIALDRSSNRIERWEFLSNGVVNRRIYGKTPITETGKWWVNKKGELCLQWPQEEKKQCSFLAPAENGGYELHGKKGKRKVVFDSVKR